MRAKYIHRTEEWLPEDFEAPPPVVASTKTSFSVWRVHRQAHTNTIGMKLHEPGTAIWSAEGKLLRYFPRGADLAWLPSGDVLSLEATGLPSRSPARLEALLRVRDGSTFEVLREHTITYPSGGMRCLVAAPDHEQFAAVWLEQDSWGYELFSLSSGLQSVGGARAWPGTTLSPPAFSTDGALLVSCHFVRGGWWTDEIDDHWEYPSEGGERKVGVITVHELATGAVSRHDVLVDLPKGWQPDRPDHGAWDMIWGPDVLDSHQLRIWLPDDSFELLTLPLPARVKVERELSTRRAWSS